MLDDDDHIELAVKSLVRRRDWGFRSTRRRKIIPTIHLPEDLVHEIFLRLPVKSLIRFRCVSKGMCGMIDSPIFIKKRNHQQYCEGSLSESDYAIIIQKSNRFFSLNFSDDLKQANPVKLDCPLYPGMALVGCCNGIFCFWKKNIDHKAYLFWNPSNGTSKKVECPFNLLPSKNLISTYTTAISIGYDRVNDDYKLTYININGKSLQVYSLRKDSWTSFDGEFLPGYPSPCFSRSAGICVSSAMHWLWKNPTDSSRFIGVFDLVTESFRSLLIPEMPRGLGMIPTGLSHFGGCLCVTFDRLGDVDVPKVWVMENYGVERSWTPLYTGQLKCRISYFPNKERRLFCNSNLLMWWDPHDYSFEEIEVEGYPFGYGNINEHFIYIRSLVRLDKKLI